jgi:hypothetical protein
LQTRQIGKSCVLRRTLRRTPPVVVRAGLHLRQNRPVGPSNTNS